MTAASPSPRNAWLRRHPRLSFSLSLAAGLLASAALRTLPAKPVTLTLSPVVRAVVEDPGAPAIGAQSPEVTIIVFTDYQCGICKRTDPALERLVAADRGVRVVYKIWPILGERSQYAGAVALAAQRQGLFGPAHRALMDHRGVLDPAAVRRAAERAGVDWSRLERDLAAEHEAIAARLSTHGGQAWTLGLSGTPGYVVGAHLYQGGLEDRALGRAVAAARRAGPIQP